MSKKLVEVVKILEDRTCLRLQYVSTYSSFFLPHLHISIRTFYLTLRSLVIHDRQFIIISAYLGYILWFKVLHIFLSLLIRSSLSVAHRFRFVERDLITSLNRNLYRLHWHFEGFVFCVLRTHSLYFPSSILCRTAIENCDIQVRSTS